MEWLGQGKLSGEVHNKHPVMDRVARPANRMRRVSTGIKCAENQVELKRETVYECEALNGGSPEAMYEIGCSYADGVVGSYLKDVNRAVKQGLNV
jgi:hypothetical protein